MSIRNLSIIGLTLASAFITQPAQARTFEVRYNPAELTTPVGAESVYDRIYTTSKDQCRFELRGTIAGHSRLALARCIGRRVDEFVDKIQHPNLDLVYTAQAGKKRTSDVPKFAQNQVN